MSWTPDARPVLVELEDGYPAREFGTSTTFATVADQIDGATWEQLKLLAAGGIGEPQS